MLVDSVERAARRPDYLAVVPALQPQLQPDPTPDSRQAFTLVDDARAQVLDTLPLLTCITLPGGTITRERVASWAHVEDIAYDQGSELIDALSLVNCPDAPMGAAVVAAWRGLASAALAYRDGHTTWCAVTNAAERSARFIRRAHTGTVHR
ncbi:hypothetical protein AB0H83_45845 [Dactylosporangium sp. NPDC050688]|uniref:hypothetical protein n=1 Tax=Dactylosporangium sp. NPDC050688 TaxID=3157217 RepID=UPI0033C4BEF0